MEIYMQMKDLALEGNLIDNGWIENLKYDSGKTNLNAVMILSEIVYWYRPTEMRDEYSGQVLGYKKKFKADKLQKSYEQLGLRFGLTKNQVKDACDYLKNDKKLIDIEFRTVQTPMGKLPNIMFVEPIMENLGKITGINRIVPDGEESSNNEGKGGYPPFKSNTTSFQKQDTPTFKSNTITEITTEITTEIGVSQSVSPDISQSMPKEKQTDRLIDYTPVIHQVIENAQVELYNADIQILVKETVKDIITLPEISSILKMGLNRNEIIDKIKKLEYIHIDRAIVKFKETQNSAGVKNVKLYFTKCLISAISETGIENMFVDIAPKTINTLNVPQYTNFEQREYSEEYYEKFYYNLQDRS